MIQQRKVVICDICGDERIIPLLSGDKLPDEWRKVHEIDVCAHCLSVLKKDYATAIKCGIESL